MRNLETIFYGNYIKELRDPIKSRVNDTFMHCFTIRGQKEKEKEKQQVLYPNIDKNPEIESITESTK